MVKKKTSLSIVKQSHMYLSRFKCLFAFITMSISFNECIRLLTWILWFNVFNFRCLSKKNKFSRPFCFPFPDCLVPQCTLANLVSTTRHNAFQTAWTHNSLENVRSTLFFAMKVIFLQAILLSSRLLWGEASSWGEVNLLVQTCSLVNKRLISC